MKNPLRDDPYRLFAHYPTHHLNERVVLEPTTLDLSVKNLAINRWLGEKSPVQEIGWLLKLGLLWAKRP